MGVIREHDGLNAAVGNLSDALAMANGAVVNGAVANDTAVKPSRPHMRDLVTRMEQEPQSLTVGRRGQLPPGDRCASRAGAHGRAATAELLIRPSPIPSPTV